MPEFPGWLSKKYTCIIDNTQTPSVSCWGDEEYNGDEEWGILSVPSDLGPVKQVAGSTRAVCAILEEDNSIRCWGDGEKPADGKVVRLLAGGKLISAQKITSLKLEILRR